MNLCRILDCHQRLIAQAKQRNKQEILRNYYKQFHQVESLGAPGEKEKTAGNRERGFRQFFGSYRLFRLSENSWRHLTGEQRDKVLLDMRADGMSERQIADETKIPKSTVHRIISTAPFGAVELPTVITGKDGKQRQATQPERKAPAPELPSIPQRPISINVAKPDQARFALRLCSVRRVTFSRSSAGLEQM